MISALTTGSTPPLLVIPSRPPPRHPQSFLDYLRATATTNLHRALLFPPPEAPPPPLADHCCPRRLKLHRHPSAASSTAAVPFSTGSLSTAPSLGHRRSLALLHAATESGSRPNQRQPPGRSPPRCHLQGTSSSTKAVLSSQLIQMINRWP